MGLIKQRQMERFVELATDQIVVLLLNDYLPIKSDVDRVFSSWKRELSNLEFLKLRKAIDFLVSRDLRVSKIEQCRTDIFIVDETNTQLISGVWMTQTLRQELHSLRRYALLPLALLQQRKFYWNQDIADVNSALFRHHQLTRVGLPRLKVRLDCSRK